VEWNVIPDGATAAAAMLRNEADWWEQPLFDLLPLMRRSGDRITTVVEVTGNTGLLRMNQLFPPFGNPGIRRALLPVLDQPDFMTAVVGNVRSAWRDNIGFFAPDTPMASDAGLSALAGPRGVDRAKQQLRQAGYHGEPVVIMAPGDYPRVNVTAKMAVDMMQRCGM
jgi:peptide/nickel transport system substrate-binding protein